LPQLPKAPSRLAQLDLKTTAGEILELKLWAPHDP